MNEEIKIIHKNGNKYYLCLGNWNNRLNYSSSLSLVESNGFFALLDCNDKVININDSIIKCLKESGDFTEDIIFVDFPLEMFEDYVYFKYGFDDEDRYIKTDLNEMISEFSKLSHSYMSKLNDIHEALQEYNKPEILSNIFKGSIRKGGEFSSELKNIENWKNSGEISYFYSIVQNNTKFLKKEKVLYEKLISKMGRELNKKEDSYEASSKIFFS